VTAKKEGQVAKAESKLFARGKYLQFAAFCLPHSKGEPTCTRMQAAGPTKITIRALCQITFAMPRLPNGSGTFPSHSAFNTNGLALWQTQLNK